MKNLHFFDNKIFKNALLSGRIKKAADKWSRKLESKGRMKDDSSNYARNIESL